MFAFKQSKSQNRNKPPSKLIYNEVPSELNVLLQSLNDTLVSYCKESSIHGVPHIIDAVQIITSRKATHSQKIYNMLILTIWVSALVLGTVFAVTLMDLVWERFQRTPTITTVETNNFPIWNVQFPAITICNNNQVYGPAVRPIIDKILQYGHPNDEVQNFMGNLSKMITSEYCTDRYQPIIDTLSSMNYTTERLMLELMQPCDLLINNCTWLGTVIPCNHLFRASKSSEGFCCSFNYKAPLDILEIDSKNEIEDQLEDPVYRVSGSGPHVGLDALINVDPDAYVSYIKPYVGASILVHGPQDFPQSVDRATFGQPGRDYIVAIIPQVVVSEPRIRALPLQKRNCLFGDEVILRTTSKYTFQSCILECAVDTILRLCYCLPFYYAETRLRPFFDGRRQCTLSDSACLRKHRHIFTSLQPDDNSTQLNGTFGMQCNQCLPSCSEETFYTQTNIARREGRNLQSVLYPNINLTNMISLKVHFRDISCIKYRRDVYVSWDGLFASFGGIFGLCLGGSVLSFVEIIYFCTFKLWNNIRIRRQSMRVTSLRLAEIARLRNRHLLQGGIKLANARPAINFRGDTKRRSRRSEISILSSNQFLMNGGRVQY